MKTVLRSCIFLSAIAASWGQPNVTAVVNAASFTAGIAPGEELSVYGSNLAPAVVAQCSTGGAFPTTCGGATVMIDGVAAPIAFVSPGQLNVFAQWELYGGSVKLQVSTSGGISNLFKLNVVPASPGIFTQDGSGTGAGDFLVGSQRVTASNPASAGNVVVGYATGLGITNPQVPDGSLTPASPLYHTAATLRITVGGVPVPAQFAGLTPDFENFYQVNFVVPAGLLGNQPVVFTADGISSPPVTLPLVAGTPSALSLTTPSSLGTFSIGEVQVGLAATGGNGSYTWSVQTGSTLPPGLALRSDVPSYIASADPAGLIGVATTPENYNFTLSVASGISAATPSFTMKITALTLQDGPVLPDGFLGTSYYGSGYPLTATDNGVRTSVTCTSTTVDGLTLSSDCTLSGTPTAAGTQTIPVTFTDGTDTVTKNLKVNVSTVRITTSGLFPNATVNAPYSQTLAAAGGTGPYTYSLSGALPAGLALNAGAISGTPTGSQGKSNFAIVVTDSASHSYTKNMAIDVIGSPEALPQIAQYGDLADCSIGMGCSRAIGVSGGGTAPFTWRVIGLLPPGMNYRYDTGSTLAYVSPGDLELFGTPSAIGTYNVTVQVTDANGLNTTQIFPLKVSPLLIDSCLTAAGCPNMPNGSVGTAYSSPFRLLGGLPPYTATAAPSRSVPTGLPSQLWLSPTAVTGIPQENGQFSPLFAITDSAGTANTLTVSETPYFNGAAGTSTTINSYPVQYATVGQPFSLQLAACCAADYAWITPPGGTPPPGLSLSFGGLVSGQPTTAGTYTWLVQAAQGSNTGNYGTRQLTVVETPIAVSGAGNLPAGAIGLAYNQSLAAIGGAGSLTWSLGPGSLLPPGLSLSTDGAIAGTPRTGGGYAFSVIAKDSANNTDLVSYTVSVYSACDVKHGGLTTVADAQQMIDEALGAMPPANDLNNDKVVNVVDIEIGMNAALGNGCSAT